MKKGLTLKLIIIFSITILFIFVIIGVIISLWAKDYFMNERQKQMRSEANIIQDIYSRDSIDAVTSQVDDISEEMNEDIILLDNIGIPNVVSNSKYEYLVTKQHQLFTKEIADLRRNTGNNVCEVQSTLFDKSSRAFLIPLYDSNSNLIQVVVMSIPKSEFTKPVYAVFKIIWALAFLAIIFLIFIIYFVSKKIIIRPLSYINVAADKISKGEADKRVEIKSNDEIGALAASFNTMADSLQQVENNRRAFISNVSHELRSPITSIKGFVAGILDGVIPLNKEKYYLNIAYEEIQRLTRLINDLLDLSAIESGSLTLKFREVELNEIIRVTVIKFENIINEKKLKVDVCFSDDKIYVRADEDRLKQILTNLIDNAMKYSKKNGKVNISTKVKGTKVLVSVHNNGESIAEEDLKHIWDRFYKSDKSRTQKVSTGLGLPIVRNILTLFGEDIWVTNKDTGVTFTFTLTKIQ